MTTPVRYREVRGVPMAYREAGSGSPIVFLHGNPTSSYLWRNILGPLAHHGRCIAPDLVGMGGSGRLPDSGPQRYRFVEHREYLDALLADLGVEDDVIIVGHDWGGVLGFDWCRRHPAATRAIAYLETLVAPVSSDSENAPDPGLFGPLRSAAGEQLVLADNSSSRRSSRPEPNAGSPTRSWRPTVRRTSSQANPAVPP